MDIIHIVAYANNRAIGMDNALPWHLPSDLAHFKARTDGGVMVMGRKTFESLGRVLAGREHIVVSRTLDYDHARVHIFDDLSHALESAKNLAKDKGRDEIFIIGGENIFKQTLTIANKLYTTQIDADIHHADAFYPPFDGFTITQKSDKHHEHGMNFCFVDYARLNA